MAGEGHRLEAERSDRGLHVALDTVVEDARARVGAERGDDAEPVAPAARAARAVATTASKSTLRKAACEPATLIVVPSAMNTSSTAGKDAGSRAKSTT